MIMTHAQTHSHTRSHDEADRPMPGLLNGVIMRLTLRATMSRRRAILFALPAIILVGISALLKAKAHSPAWPPEVLGILGYLILALTALIVGGSVLGAEVDDGSILHLLATPVSRRTIVLSKYVVAVGLTIVFAAIPVYLAGVIATGASSHLAIGLFVGAVAGAVIYNALFLLLTAVFSPGPALAIGLLYILVWENLLASLVPGVGLLSAEHYSLAVANSIAHNSLLHANVNLGTGVGMGAAVTVLALGYAVVSLSGFNVKGDLA
jgi:ABC-2 type transport system permease protein